MGHILVTKNLYVANRKLPRIHLKRKNLLFDCGTPDAVLKNINIPQEVKRLKREVKIALKVESLPTHKRMPITRTQGLQRWHRNFHSN